MNFEISLTPGVALIFSCKSLEDCSDGVFFADVLTLVLKLSPGWVHTGERGRSQPKPDAAWSPEETVAYMLNRLANGDFYIICPDNDVPSDLDNLRIAWSVGDMTENRPALSRWHNDYKGQFDEFVRNGVREKRADRSRSRGRINTFAPSPLHDNV